MEKKLNKNLVRLIEVIFFITIFSMFILIANKYLNFERIVTIQTQNIKDFLEKIKPEEKIVCKNSQIKITVKDGELCRDNVQYSGSENDIYLKIFDTYQKHGDNKEIIYKFLDEGDIDIANDYLNNQIDIERYDPITIENINWDEDPYGETYWRFLFYSLRETRHLLFAYKETGDEKYLNKLLDILDSFSEEGINKQISWNDYHAVAFRGMVLTNTWWKLREENVLTVEMNEKILKAIKKHGDFLLDDNHYESKYNHGLNQSIALLLIGVNFPELDTSEKWVEVSKKRISNSLDSLIDKDGVLVENSPYYHFYVLEKYWWIKQYFIKNNIEIGNDFVKKIDKMISYATYILQPDLEVPLLGASLKRSVGNAGVNIEIAKDNSEFLYIITQGKEGVAPTALNKYYPSTGQVIMRSDWGGKTKFDNTFVKQTQLIFDVGPYRTSHSDLDALSFNLYSNGKTLLTDTGLYTYQKDDKLKEYFHGTYGHNTIIVDGQDQRIGAPIAGIFKEGNGYSSYSTQHNLYPQTYHQRGMMLIGHDLVVIVDRMISDREHDYEQLFHLAPELKAETNNDGSITVKNNEQKEEMKITQFFNDGLEIKLGDIEKDPENNICSFEYGKTIPCQTISFKKHAQNTTLITLIQIGESSNKKIKTEITDNNQIKIVQNNTEYQININTSDSDFFEQSKIIDKVTNNYLLNLTSNIDGDDWKISGEGSELFETIKGENGKIILNPKSIDKSLFFPDKPSYEANIENSSTYYSIDEKLYLDVPWSIKEKNYKIYEQEDFLPILGYHNIINDEQEIKSPTLEIHNSDFEKQIDYMTNTLGCRWFTFSDIMQNYVLKGEKTPKRACLLNFDDGRKNHFINGYPIFKKYGALATFYVITERSQSDNSSYMNLSELDELYRNGNEIGSHTVNTNNLLDKKLSIDDITYQLKESKKILEDQGYKINTFAYPQGNQNEKIINLTKEFYLAGRDTQKDYTWADLRPSTISFDNDYAYHMNYHKPELETVKELGEKLGYNNWWQFEEGKKINIDEDGDVSDLSSYAPTKNSYAVVTLPDIGDKISNKFIVGQDGEYTIETYITANEIDKFEDFSIKPVKIYIDNIEKRVYPRLNGDCKTYKQQYYCYFDINTHLSKGIHTLSMQSNLKNIRLDKFRMYREIPTQNSYQIEIKEHKGVVPENNPENLEISLIENKLPTLFNYKLLYLLLLIPFVYLLKKKL